MEGEREVSFIELVGMLNETGIRYLVIGRRALILYGAPVMTGDYDLWIDPKDRRRVLELLENLGAELSHPVDTKRPLIFAYSGSRKYDLFFHGSVTNSEGEKITFESCHAAAVRAESSGDSTIFPLPSIDDLIKMKKIRGYNPKDEQDIEYLLSVKRMSR